jgi:hypothetical protein
MKNVINRITDFFKGIDFKDGIPGDICKILLTVIAVFALNGLDLFLPFGETFAYLAAVLSTTSVIVFIAAASHLMRKIFFPDVSMTNLIRGLENEPIARALVFLGIVLILATLVICNVWLLVAA